VLLSADTHSHQPRRRHDRLPGKDRFRSPRTTEYALAVDTGGTTRFGGAVGSQLALASLDVAGAGPIALDGGSVITTGSQDYAGAVTLGVDTTLTSTGNAGIGFGSTIDGGYALTSATAGTTTLGGAVGGTTALAALTVSGLAAIDGGLVETVTTAAPGATGLQSYGDTVTLGDDTVLRGVGGSFAGGVDGAGFDLTLDFSATTTVDGDDLAMCAIFPPAAAGRPSSAAP
jgi:hypothetical protein